ncbi:MAG: nitrate ABC transporter ATP-binding protein [Gammaproteobacteria bacterium RIFCSPHIGHO2_12_FULL_35_23]|nr:MAG: nitrate ABC transporter ATP-binding protein [Gammaproteobacteria bacterium RIFCSPHIGHO2_12_FULL_35_23]
MSEKLIELKSIKKIFRNDPQQELLVLEDVSFSMCEGEIVALLGRSGSGKSTLLRIIAGLIEPTAGEVYYRNKKVNGPVHGIAMVFQSFALMPWLTVLQNVELGLEALGVKKEERRQRALKAIDIVGLDGFESAFPKELSGGMRQRVGFARALVVEPNLLLMDEPFSSLDVLTSDNLRNDLLELWEEGRAKLKGILLVTHDIYEAISMADRILIFDSNPGKILHDLPVHLPRPRDDELPAFKNLLDKIYTLMTSSSSDIEAETKIDLSYRVPDAQVSELIGLLETIEYEEAEGALDFSYLAEIVQLDVDELLALTEVLDILHFTKSQDGGIHLTEAGEKFANADILEQKKIFARHLMQYIPLVKRICDVLRKRSNNKVSKKYFLAELEDYFSDEDAERVLRVIIEWGRFAELFAYDDNTGKLSLENPE